MTKLVKDINKLFYPVLRGMSVCLPVTNRMIFDERLQTLYPGDQKKTYVGYGHCNIISNILNNSIKKELPYLETDVITFPTYYVERLLQDRYDFDFDHIEDIHYDPPSNITVIEGSDDLGQSFMVVPTYKTLLINHVNRPKLGSLAKLDPFHVHVFKMGEVMINPIRFEDLVLYFQPQQPYPPQPTQPIYL